MKKTIEARGSQGSLASHNMRVACEREYRLIGETDGGRGNSLETK